MYVIDTVTCFSINMKECTITACDDKEGAVKPSLRKTHITKMTWPEYQSS